MTEESFVELPSMHALADLAGDDLVAFVKESNRIESIHRPPTDEEVEAHRIFLRLEKIDLPTLEMFVARIAGVKLRDQPHMNVRIGNHHPPQGGPEMRHWVEDHIRHVREDHMSTYEAHCAYETLHPFMDGNGRSGRALWAWQKLHQGRDPFWLPFLHQFYYEALDNSQARYNTYGSENAQ